MRSLWIYLAATALSCASFVLPDSEVDLDKVDDADTRAIVKASYLYNFGVQCDWPAEYKQGRFQIAVLGNDAVYHELASKYVGKPVGGQVLEIIRATEIEDIERPHVVYVSEAYHGDLAELCELTEAKPMLIACEMPGALNQGGTVNFIVKDSKIRYELNAALAAEKGITLGTNIVHWAVQP